MLFSLLLSFTTYAAISASPSKTTAGAIISPSGSTSSSNLANPQQGPLRVMIDPGHGGVDAGAVVKGHREADLVLQVSKLLKERLDQDARFHVTMTRAEDVRVSLGERVKKAGQTQADLFLSLHLNSNEDHRVKGMEVYIQNHLPPDDESLLLASIENQKELMHEVQGKALSPSTESLSKKTDIAMILEDLHRSSRLRSSHRLSRHIASNWKEVQTDSRAPSSSANSRHSQTIRQAPFYVITRLGIPAALLELGFLTHDQERKAMTSIEVQKQMADNIYLGLVSYLDERQKL